MRFVIHAMVLGLIALGLFLFEDVNAGLPVMTVAVWTVVAITGLFLVTRLNGRPRRRYRHVRRAPVRDRRFGALLAKRRKTLFLPPR